MKPLGSWTAALVLGASIGTGCSSPARQFKITSFPTGAKIYLDDMYQGPTGSTAYTLSVPFETKIFATLRLEKDWYQPVGMVLSPESPDELNFVLHEAPKNKDILKSLNDILKVLENIESRLRSTERGGNQG